MPISGGQEPSWDVETWNSALCQGDPIGSVFGRVERKGTTATVRMAKDSSATGQMGAVLRATTLWGP